MKVRFAKIAPRPAAERKLVKDTAKSGLNLSFSSGRRMLERNIGQTKRAGRWNDSRLEEIEGHKSTKAGCRASDIGMSSGERAESSLTPIAQVNYMHSSFFGHWSLTGYC